MGRITRKHMHDSPWKRSHLFAPEILPHSPPTSPIDLLKIPACGLAAAVTETLLAPSSSTA